MRTTTTINSGKRTRTSILKENKNEIEEKDEMNGVHKKARKKVDDKERKRSTKTTRQMMRTRTRETRKPEENKLKEDDKDIRIPTTVRSASTPPRALSIHV